MSELQTVYVVDEAKLRKQKDRMAELVSDGTGVVEAGLRIGLKRGESLNLWHQIKQDLGEQAR